MGQMKTTMLNLNAIIVELARVKKCQPVVSEIPDTVYTQRSEKRFLFEVLFDY